MTTNSVTMDTLSEKILQDIADMEQQIEEFGALLSEGDERKEALDSASAELAKYRKTVESLLVTSAENKTQAYVSATSNLPMFNEHIENYMNRMLAPGDVHQVAVTLGLLHKGQGFLKFQAAGDHLRGKYCITCGSDRDHAGTAAVGHRPGEKGNETGR